MRSPKRGTLGNSAAVVEDIGLEAPEKVLILDLVLLQKSWVLAEWSR